MLWLNEAVDRFPAMGFRTRIVACAAAAAALPFMPLAAGGAPGAILAATLVGMAWFLFCITRLLLPIRDAAEALQACADGRPLPAFSSQPDDEIMRMTANIRFIASRLDRNATTPLRRSTDIPLAPELRRAIDGGQFLLHYQPLVDLATARPIGAEALLRWNHPSRGLLAPAEFGATSDQCALIDELGPWILDEACRQAHAWDDKGLTGLRMTVNLSPLQMRDPALGAAVMQAIERHGLQPDRLELECAESTLLADVEQSRARFSELRALGIGVAIDDFGRGYSHLSLMGTLPFSTLKIDPMLASGIHREPEKQAVCRAVIALGRGLSAKLLAEGIETREEVEVLRSLGCTAFQGNYFARALAPDAFIVTVDDPNWLALLASPVHREIAGLQNRIG